jgi:hypothetical protein
MTATKSSTSSLTPCCRLLDGGLHGNGSDVGPFAISSDSYDDLFSSLNMCVPFLPCLWTAKKAPGSREFEYTFDGGQYRETGKAPAVFHMKQRVLYILKC